jgi:gliding motility-associated-like protein
MGTAVNNQHQHEYGNEGIYYAVVIGNLQGCGITDTIMVNAYGESAIGCPEGLVNCSDFQIPNIITPNGDDFNDFFWVPNVHLKELDVKIFNRWGLLVGQISEPNHYWDVPKAQWSGEGMDSGVYFYTISAQGKDRVNFQRQGNFQLVK